jgi:chemotaxis methyl-accepting protein methylase
VESAEPYVVTAELVQSNAVRILDRALALLRDRRGLDFSRYRRGTIERRMANRMISVRQVDAEGYLALLEESEHEVDSLVRNLSIKVTRFYRNAAVFDLLRDSLLREVRDRFPGQPLAAWSAGCASGEEAYTLAMLLGDDDRVDATDIDAVALSAATKGRYARTSLGELPAMLANAWLDALPQESDVLQISPALQGRVRFLHHDLMSLAPPSRTRYHLVCCRNVLIYLTRPLQLEVERTLIDALAPGGLLVLGEAEWPIDPSALEVVDRKARVFRRREGSA